MVFFFFWRILFFFGDVGSHHSQMYLGVTSELRKILRKSAGSNSKFRELGSPTVLTKWQ